MEGCRNGELFFMFDLLVGLQGGLIGLAAFTVALTKEAAQYLEVSDLIHVLEHVNSIFVLQVVTFRGVCYVGVF